MKYNPEIHHRKSIRLKEYDYSQNGLYFITICTHNRQHLFGKIVDNEMIFNDAGKIVENEIMNTNKIRKNIEINHFVVMPNHIHFIIEILDYKDNICRGDAVGSPKLKPNSIGSIIGQIKSISTKKYNKIIKRGHATGKPLQWQRNYHEHIIRNEKSYKKIAEYIKNNPILWKDDKYNQQCRPKPCNHQNKRIL